MSEEEIDRKIAVIFATDVVGYSKHMEADENETVKNLRACEKILTGLFKKYKGRLFNSGGDSFLAEFPSAVSAIECAVEFQKMIKERNSSEEASVKLQFRIGINSGDVIKENGNLLGDGVNIAARLEALAQSGGVSISKSIFDYVSNKTGFEFNDQGLQKVKQNEFYVYDVVLDQNQKRVLKREDKKKFPIIIAVTSLLIIVCLGFFFANPFKQEVQKDKTTELIDTRSNIIIMPFENQTGKEENSFLQEALALGINNTLSDLNLDVKFVDPSETRSHAEKNTPYRELSGQHNIDYIVTGLIQGTQEVLRIQMRIDDLVSSETVFKDEHEFKKNIDLIEIQDTLAMYLMKGISRNISTKQHIFSYTTDPSIYFDLIKIDKALLKSTVESVTLAGELVDKNLKIAPNDPHILQIATFHTWLKVNLGMTDDPAAEINKGVDLLSRGIQLVNEGEPIYIYLLAQKSIWQAILQKFDEACAVIPELKQFERRIYDDHLSQFDFGLLYQVCFSDGSSEEKFQKGIKFMERSLELRSSAFNAKYLAYGYAYKTYAFGDDTKKLEALWLREKSKKNHNDPMAMPTIGALLAYGYAREGRNDSAAKTLEVAKSFGRQYTAQSPYADYPSMQDKSFLADIGLILKPYGLSSE